jgi:hypothetical protein
VKPAILARWKAKTNLPAADPSQRPIGSLIRSETSGNRFRQNKKLMVPESAPKTNRREKAVERANSNRPAQAADAGPRRSEVSDAAQKILNEKGKVGRPRVPIRPEFIRSLRDKGLSLRKIAAATGLGYGSVRRALVGQAQSADDPPSRPA